MLAAFFTHIAPRYQQIFAMGIGEVVHILFRFSESTAVFDHRTNQYIMALQKPASGSMFLAGFVTRLIHRA